MHARVSLLILDVMPIKWSLHGYRHDYLKFYQSPNSNLFTHRLLFFSREATSQTYFPGSLSHIICLCDLFSFSFIFRSIKLKIQKYLTAIYSYLFCLAFNLLQFSHVRLPILGRRYPKGIDNHFYTLGCEYFLFVCRGYYIVLLGSPTGSITLDS